MSDGLSSTPVRKILSDAYEEVPLAETVPETPDVSVDYDSLRDEHPLGAGGNADVFRAVSETDGRTVTLAIKEP